MDLKLTKKTQKAISRYTAIAYKNGHKLEKWYVDWIHPKVWQTTCNGCNSYIFLFTDKKGNPRRHYSGLYECQSNHIFKENYKYIEMNECWAKQRKEDAHKKEEIRFKRLITVAKKHLNYGNLTAPRLARLLLKGVELLNYDEIEADEIEAHLLKKTTQDSPEWHGGANCGMYHGLTV